MGLIIGLLAACGDAGGTTPGKTPSMSASFGEVEWTSPGWSGVFGLQRVALNERIVAAVGYAPGVADAPPPEVAAWDRETGGPKWSLRVEDLKTQVGASSIHMDGIWSASNPDSEVAFAVTTADAGDALVGVAPETGKLTWTWGPSNRSKATGFSDVVGGDDESVVIVTTGETSSDGACAANRRSAVTTAVDIATGKTIWERRGLCAPRQLVDGRLLFDDQVLDAETGEQIWHTDEPGEVLGASGSAILWAPGAESETNPEEPRLIDVLDPDKNLPTLPTGIAQRIYGQHGVLTVPVQASSDEALQLWTFRSGDRSFHEADLADATTDSIVGSLDELLIQSSEDGVNLLDSRGKQVAQWTGGGSVSVVDSVNDAVVLSITNGDEKKWVLLPVNIDS